jgi:NAD+ kinase
LTFQSVGILLQPKIEQAEPLAREISQAFVAAGYPEPWQCSAWDEEAMRARIPGSDLLLTLGGDGTILRVVRQAAPFGVPILGMKLGRLGFLAEIQPDSWRYSLAQLLEERYWIEERMLLRARIERNGQPLPETRDALNEVVIGRGSLARLVRVAAYLDGGYLTTYVADGVIVSTATGSTAYALAVGGPILPPELKNILLLPIAPHLSMDRALVLGQGATVRLQVFTDHRAMVTVDGQIEVELHDGDVVIVTASPLTSRFVRLRERNYFYRALMDKLKWTV